eukprot:CAMPEP_0116845972 /NCGR_PEP_ID=MMETSP0418-20121206/13581_1 /TAXON_ID=1158023 /ORGANISM="Astrosyne radiata, Strain 13vi08-1A" /LENGTH=275 /DNA_ID=CAMNT_0004477177 /DNA_START=335 /DNA_END=1162 /DNA_ORIENTATION=+
MTTTASPRRSTNDNNNNNNNNKQKNKKRRNSPKKSTVVMMTTTTTTGNRKSKSPRKKQQQQEILSEKEKSRYIALDCEMVGVGEQGHESALARVVMVNWEGHLVLDLYVKPKRPVTDYRTFVSGITPQLLENAVSLETCRALCREALRDKVLVGHGLKGDLRVLQLTHPWYDTRDTAKYEPFMKVRFPEDGILWPRKLRDLALENLEREIQTPGLAHSPVEDAQTAMDLYKCVRTKWEKVMDYKIKKTRAIQQQQQQQQQLAPTDTTPPSTVPPQ